MTPDKIANVPNFRAVVWTVVFREEVIKPRDVDTYRLVPL